MNSEQLSAIVAGVLSLAFSYIPGVSVWFDGLQKEYKQALMGTLLVLSAAAVFGLSCAGLLDSVACTKDGAIGFLSVLLSALFANQSVYLLTKK